eukprot:CAMPEP_0113457236 /NCGR_PEP_ID=MMETSP0014_2-20120614/9302_1 /TAXON_ID=2857 /ORGANISM="Nitzschia sp." /LENGTH=1049 /DNA_ID=CAMNT_0000348721 /DNA_START=531 /DNA_END=3680 /DNA_ORIENTATION=- /assembly_acc=CAM_ASM_000159
MAPYMNNTNGSSNNDSDGREAAAAAAAIGARPPNVFNAAQERDARNKQEHMSRTFQSLLRRKRTCIARNLSKEEWTKLISDINEKIGWDLTASSSSEAARKITDLLQALYYQKVTNKHLAASERRQAYNIYETVQNLLRDVIRTDKSNGGDGNNTAPVVQHRHRLLGKKGNKNPIIASLTLPPPPPPSLPVAAASASTSASTGSAANTTVNLSVAATNGSATASGRAPSVAVAADTAAAAVARSSTANNNHDKTAAITTSREEAVGIPAPPGAASTTTGGAAAASAASTANAGGSISGGSRPVASGQDRRPSAGITALLAQKNKATHDAARVMNEELDNNIGPHGFSNSSGGTNRASNNVAPAGMRQQSNSGPAPQPLPPPPYTRRSGEVQQLLSSRSAARDRAPEPSFAANAGDDIPRQPQQLQQEEEEEETCHRQRTQRSNDQHVSGQTSASSTSASLNHIARQAGNSSGGSNSRGNAAALSAVDSAATAATSGSVAPGSTAASQPTTRDAAASGGVARASATGLSSASNGASSRGNSAFAQVASRAAAASQSSPKSKTSPGPKWEVEEKTRSLKFVADRDGKLGGFYDWREKPHHKNLFDIRPEVEVHYRKYKTTQAGGDVISKRLELWEANWPNTGDEWRGVTSPVERCNFISKTRRHSTAITDPHTVASFEIRGIAGKLLDNATLPEIKSLKPFDGSKRNNEFRVLLQMVPFDRTEKQKIERADCHLWPKGTTVFFRAGHPGSQKKVINISQRTQLNCDLNAWKYMCHTLDLTPHFVELIEWSERNGGRSALKNIQTSFSILCHDEQIFGFRVSLSKYRSPLVLSKRLLNDVAVNKESNEAGFYEESLGRARQIMRANHVSLDADDGEEGLQHLTFKLFDNGVTKKPIVHPVRGKNCHHFTCFDLDAFLQMNEGVSGKRYACPVCETLFISPSDLEYCAVTANALKKFEKDINEERQNVKLFSNGNMELLPAKTLDEKVAEQRAVKERKEKRKARKRKREMAKEDPRADVVGSADAKSNQRSEPSNANKKKKPAEVEVIDLSED